MRAKVEGRDEPAVLRHRRLQRAAVAGAARRQRQPRRASIRACRSLAFALDSSKGPSQIGTLVPADGGSQAWTRPLRAAGRRHRRASRSSRSSAGRASTAARSPASPTCPPARFAGRRPVLIDIHGGPEGRRRVRLPRPRQLLPRGARRRRDPAERARLRRLRQDLPLARRRQEARGLGQGHRRPARLDRDPAAARPEPGRRRRRQLRRLHEPGGGRRPTPSASPARSTSSASPTSSASSRTPRATGATCAGSSTATSATRRCARS